MKIGETHIYILTRMFFLFRDKLIRRDKLFQKIYILIISSNPKSIVIVQFVPKILFRRQFKSNLILAK
jgi:hypothetical protein